MRLLLEEYLSSGTQDSASSQFFELIISGWMASLSSGLIFIPSG
jgi:hypothetical protein